jgi:hypothetical protein
MSAQTAKEKVDRLIKHGCTREYLDCWTVHECIWN